MPCSAPATAATSQCRAVSNRGVPTLEQGRGGSRAPRLICQLEPRTASWLHRRALALRRREGLSHLGWAAPPGSGAGEGTQTCRAVLGAETLSHPPAARGNDVLAVVWVVLLLLVEVLLLNTARGCRVPGKTFSLLDFAFWRGRRGLMGAVRWVKECSGSAPGLHLLRQGPC